MVQKFQRYVKLIMTKYHIMQVNKDIICIIHSNNFILTQIFEIRMSGTGNASGTVHIGNLIKVNNDVTTKLVEDILSYGTVNTIGDLYFSIKYQD